MCMRRGSLFICLTSFCVSYVSHLCIVHCVSAVYSWLCPGPVCSHSTALLALALASLMGQFIGELFFLGGGGAVCAYVCPSQVAVHEFGALGQEVGVVW